MLLLRVGVDVVVIRRCWCSVLILLLASLVLLRCPLFAAVGVACCCRLVIMPLLVLLLSVVAGDVRFA